MNSLSSDVQPVDRAAPIMMWLPRRSEALLDCWIAIRHVVSIYHAGSTVFIHLNTGVTLGIVYAADCAWTTAAIAERFVHSMSKPLTTEERDAMPKPTGGSIGRMR